MTNSDDKVLNILRQLIKEVKQEIATKKVIVESKTPQDVFNKHEKSMKEYIIENIKAALKESKR
jgi:hypothetical protein